jgi:hypothetical protein
MKREAKPISGGDYLSVIEALKGSPTMKALAFLHDEIKQRRAALSVYVDTDAGVQIMLLTHEIIKKCEALIEYIRDNPL